MKLALERLAAKTPIASALDTEGWSNVPVGLRNRAMFSAAIESAKFLQTVQDKLTQAFDPSDGHYDKTKFVAQMRKLLGASEGDSGNLQDITSTKRLGLIYDMQVEDARGYAGWVTEQDEDILDAFPAQELYRLIDSRVPRDWSKRWKDAGGKFYDGRMIARKDDSVWVKISRFGNPWPPFDFNSGMDIQDVERNEAIALGVIGAVDEVRPQNKDFNESLQASCKGLSEGMQSALKTVFKDQISIRDGVASWS